MRFRFRPREKPPFGAEAVLGLLFRRPCAGAGDAAFAAAFGRDPYLQSYAFAHGLHVGNDPYHLASAVQGRKVYGVKVSKPQTLYIKRIEVAAG